MTEEELIAELAAVLKQIVGQRRPNKWGYDAAYIALDDEWRERARKALALATTRGEAT